MWVTKLLISPVKKRIFCPKTTQFGPKLAFLLILGQALPAQLVPCRWVGWWLWHGLYLARHLFSLWYSIDRLEYSSCHCSYADPNRCVGQYKGGLDNTFRPHTNEDQGILNIPSDPLQPLVNKWVHGCQASRRLI